MKSSMLKKTGFRWALLIFVASCWMSMGLLSECDPAIAGPVITGVGNATADVVSVAIQAIFQSLVPEVPTPVTSGT